ncbi:uncharacterized protein LOC107013856 [Solanum pennellii]|uniref:Uncharacterized protein LOC107013856 n=1 Tax=Solanum pennellii TaxID=28526 RepID=A0ABM1GCM5_SOLPN|nr:uncharacterized protein LOC107013856 [Solanum pennellii]
MASFLPQFLIPNSDISATPRYYNLQIPSGYGNTYRIRQPFLSNEKKSYVLWSKCGKGDSIEKRFEEQIDNLGSMSGKCKEVMGGMVELLECLEREAIMGDDEGKAPMDYNRRAQIFEKSSTVFQALKKTTTSND